MTTMIWEPNFAVMRLFQEFCSNAHDDLNLWSTAVQVSFFFFENVQGSGKFSSAY
jgi:hypothetical protein